MGRFIFQRFWQSLISLFVLIIIIFILARVSGDPAVMLLPTDASPADIAAMHVRLGLDKPYPVQFWVFISHLARGDFGQSISYHDAAFSIYLQRLPNTIKLVGVGVLFAILLSIPLGVLAGTKRGKWIDQVTRAFAVVGIAAPSFWIALVLMNIFAVQLKILPSARMGGFDHYILPAFSMCLVTLAAMVRLLRSSLIEVQDSEFVKLARIKGVSSSMVLWKHTLRNSLITVVTFLGTYIGIIMGGTVIIETVFAWPGAGRLAYDGIMQRDYPLVQTVIICHGVIIVCINLVVDILYSYIDPRIRVR
jgi:peptide/nickel transport system permease protein